VTINWFPGHMNKARREITEAMAQTDVVIEVRDARLPSASANPMLEELRDGRPCVCVLNKADLADPETTRAWLSVLSTRPGLSCLAITATEQAEVRRIPKLCRTLTPSRGGPGKPVRALVVGIPNVGKSTVINSLKGKRVAEVADRPAVTRRKQRVELDIGFLLSDTPGVLWPKLEDQDAAHRLAASGGIGAAAFDTFDVAHFTLAFLAEHYTDALKQRYRLESTDQGANALLEDIARARGLLLRKGVPDLERAADVLLREVRSGKLGRISFEFPTAEAPEPGGEDGTEDRAASVTKIGRP
jgi:ribosome biogenesis GTPase A